MRKIYEPGKTKKMM